MSDNPYDALDDGPNPYDALDAPDAPKFGTGHPQDATAAGLLPMNSPASKAQFAPTEGMSEMQKFMAGAGKAQVDAWHGVKQLFGQEPQAEIDAAAQRDKPLMQTGAGLAGNIAGTVADAVIPAGMAADAAGAVGLGRTAATLGGIANPATLGAGAASGAIQGAMQPVATGDSRGFNVAAGGVLGAAGNLVARGVSAFTPTAEDAASKAVQALTDAGVPLDAAQRTGSMLLQRAKAMLSDNPFTAGAQRDFAALQKTGFNKAVLSTIGEDGAKAATPDVMQGARERMGQVYDDVSSRVAIPYSQIEAPLSNIEIESRKVLNDQQFATVQRNLDNIMSKASDNGGYIGGPQFQNIKKTLDKLSMGSDSDVGSVARDMRQTLHDGLLQSAAASGNTADVAALKTVNQQWGNMRKIEGAIDTEGNGDISPAKLANIFGQKANRYISVYGQGDTSLNDLAQAGKTLLPDKTPNSGTVSRIAAQAALPLAVGGGEAIYSGDWKKGLGAAAGAYVLPKLVQSGINSQGAFGQAIGRAGSPASLPTLFGGALQHVPLSSLAAVQNRLYMPAKEAEPGQ